MSGIVPGISGETTSPSSPEETRRKLKDSDEAKGEMAIERYLYITDPYRASSHPNPLPYPVHGTEVPNRLAPEQKADVLDLLAACGFSGQVEIFLENITKPGYSPAGDIGVKTLRILYNTSLDTLGDFSSAATSILEYLISHGFPDINVDIAHGDLCFKPSLFPISPTDPAAAVYESIKDELLEMLQENLGSSWKLISLFQVGRTQETSLPTVVVLVQPMKTHDWAGLQEAAKKILDGHGSDHISLHCEFLPGNFPEYAETSYQYAGATGMSQLGTISDECRVEMGFSIGICGESRGGTAGGFVTLKQNGMIWKGIITNHHVATTLTTTASSRIVDQANVFGFSPPEDDDTAVKLQFFAGGDVEATKQHIDMRFRNLEQLFSEYTNRQERLTLQKAQPSAFSHLQTAISDTQTNLEKTGRIQSFLADMPFHLGNVLLSSGNLIYHDKIHDWAFVELSNDNADPSSDDSNPTTTSVSAAQFQPNYMPSVPPNHDPTQYGFEFDLGPKSLRWPLVTFGQLHPGKYYIKQGRSTGVTGGVCNGVLAVCNWTLGGSGGDGSEGARRRRVLYDEFGKHANYDPQSPHTGTCTTEEYVILSKSRSTSDYNTYTQSSFCEPGDDGSFIIGADGSVCGLLYGTATALCSGGNPAGRGSFYPGAGLAMCFSNIMDSLELRTRATDREGNPVGAPAVFELPDLTE
ncbi:hypothetical protein AJ78_03297 [Emergomyces pasteurianus Ep9510]|uniref:Uncharacterized protein n=1 Tax=Emergomyces pasteurianus Ep9510 TaxID=1447872 RepID=A0A1J9PJ98_9EURO|nr:hypothetical protein AJ78_03297 [Emergomyces pasteurianus Ep9510]